MFKYGACNHVGVIVEKDAKHQVSCNECKTSGPTTNEPHKAVRGWELMAESWKVEDCTKGSIDKPIDL